jgi:hypothetical protein
MKIRRIDEALDRKRSPEKQVPVGKNGRDPPNRHKSWRAR